MKKILSSYTVLFSLLLFFCADTQATGEGEGEDEDDYDYVLVKNPVVHAAGMVAQTSLAPDTQIIDGEKKKKYDLRIENPPLDLEGMDAQCSLAPDAQSGDSEGAFKGRQSGLRIEIPSLDLEEGASQEEQGASVFSRLLAFYNPREALPPKVQGVQMGGFLELIHFPLDALRFAAYPDLALKANVAQIALQIAAIYKLVEAGEPQAALYFVPHLALDLAYPLAKYCGVDEATLSIAGGVGAVLTVPLCLYSLWSLAEKYSRHPNTD